MPNFCSAVKGLSLCASTPDQFSQVSAACAHAWTATAFPGVILSSAPCMTAMKRSAGRAQLRAPLRPAALARGAREHACCGLGADAGPRKLALEKVLDEAGLADAVLTCAAHRRPPESSRPQHGAQGASGGAHPAAEPWAWRQSQCRSAAASGTGRTCTFPPLRVRSAARQTRGAGGPSRTRADLALVQALEAVDDRGDSRERVMEHLRHLCGTLQ
jgi:hypothetical protein